MITGNEQLEQTQLVGSNFLHSSAPSNVGIDFSFPKSITIPYPIPFPFNPMLVPDAEFNPFEALFRSTGNLTSKLGFPGYIVTGYDPIGTGAGRDNGGESNDPYRKMSFGWHRGDQGMISALHSSIDTVPSLDNPEEVVELLVEVEDGSGERMWTRTTIVPRCS